METLGLDLKYGDDGYESSSWTFYSVGSSFGPGSTVRLRAPFWLERFGNGLQHARRTRIANNGMTGKTADST